MWLTCLPEQTLFLVGGWFDVTPHVKRPWRRWGRMDGEVEVVLAEETSSRRDQICVSS